jgi:GcrA cell cycle regulator
MTDFNWTAERDDQLRAMRADGMSMQLAAAKLGCTRNSAIGRAHRLGIIGAPRKQSQGGRPSRRRKPRSFAVPAASNPEPSIPLELPPEPPRRPGKRCTIFEVTGCRWIDGDPRDPDHSYCNVPRVEGLSYCPEHARLCLTPPGSRRDWR